VAPLLLGMQPCLAWVCLFCVRDALRRVIPLAGTRPAFAEPVRCGFSFRFNAVACNGRGTDRLAISHLSAQMFHRRRGKCMVLCSRSRPDVSAHTLNAGKPCACRPWVSCWRSQADNFTIGARTGQSQQFLPSDSFVGRMTCLP
jgi:hypothetical protein